MAVPVLRPSRWNSSRPDRPNRNYRLGSLSAVRGGEAWSYSGRGSPHIRTIASPHPSSAAPAFMRQWACSGVERLRPPLPVRPCTRRPSAPRRHARTCAGSHPLATVPCRSDRGSCASDIPRSSPARLPVQIRAHTVEGHGHAVKDGHIFPREGHLGTAAFFEPRGERDDVVSSCRPALAVTAAQEF